MVQHIDGMVFIVEDIIMHLFDISLLQEDVEKSFVVAAS